MSDKPGQEKIIDADVEPLEKPGRSRRGTLILYTLGAILLSVAIAVGYQLAVTGRLDDLLAGRGIAPQTTSVPAPSRPAATPVAPAPPTMAAAPAPVSAADPRLDALEQRLAALTAGIERLQQLPAANAVDPRRLNELEQQIAALRQASEATAAQRAALQSQVGDLQARVAELTEARSAALRELVREPVLQAIVWSELREKAGRGEKFVNEATQLGQYAEAQGGNLKTAFAALQPFAEQPSPSAAALATRFAAAAEQQRAAPQGQDAAGASEKSWWQRSLDKITGLISIRRVGTLDSATVEGRLDIAQTALGQDDLAAAVAALDGMAPVASLKDWRAQAEARLKLDAALDAYGAALRGHLAVR